MFGILVVTHGTMAEGIVDSLEMIMGNQEQLKALSFKPGDDINSLGEDIQNSIKILDTGEGVLVLVDLFGASPYNQAAMSKKELPNNDYRLVTGVSLPMLIEACSQRHMGKVIGEAYTVVIESAKDGVKEFFELLEERNK